MQQAFPPPPFIAGLTEDRLLIWRMNHLTGQPVRLLGGIPLRSVERLKIVDDNSFTLPAELRFVDGSAVRGEVRVRTQPLEFAQALTRLKT